jgi:hypothetical protein
VKANVKITAAAVTDYTLPVGTASLIGALEIDDAWVLLVKINR